MAFDRTQKQVIAAISKLDFTAIRRGIQASCIDIIGHAMAHGSSPCVESLCSQLDITPMGRKHVPAVTLFMVKHGPFVHSKATGWQFSKAKRDAITEEGYDFDDLSTTLPMWDDVPKAAPKELTIDLFKEVEKLIAKAAKMAQGGHCANADMLEHLNATVGAYVGRRVVAEALEASRLAALAKVPTKVAALNKEKAKHPASKAAVKAAIIAAVAAPALA